jgi:hypothetical protein
MVSKKGYILVEGHGEVEAAENLITRLSHDLGHFQPWTTPRRWPNLHQWRSSGKGGVLKGVEFVRSKKDAGALLLLKDEDDGCPKTLAPAIADKLKELELPFPVAYVLLHPEYEVLFLPCIDRMGFPVGTQWDADSWEARRGIKEWLSSRLPRGRSYKPTVMQLTMTRQVDFARLREVGIPSFGSLERALIHLGRHFGQPGSVYPG